MKEQKIEVSESRFMPPMRFLQITPSHQPVRRPIDPEQLAAMKEVSSAMLGDASAALEQPSTDIPVMEGGIGM